MTPDAGFNSYGREGVWSSGRISPSSCCQIGFVAMRGPPQLAQCSTQHSTGTHTISLITVRAGSTDSRATPALCDGIPPQAKPTGATCWTEIAEIDSQTGSSTSVQGGLTQRCCRAGICAMCANLTVYLFGL